MDTPKTIFPDHGVRGDVRSYTDRELFDVSKWLAKAAEDKTMTDGAPLYSILGLLGPGPDHSMRRAAFPACVVAHLALALKCKSAGTDFDVDVNSPFYRPLCNPELKQDGPNNIRSCVSQVMELYDMIRITEVNKQGKLDFWVSDVAKSELKKFLSPDFERIVVSPSLELFAIAAVWFSGTINEHWLYSFLSDRALFTTTVYVLTAPFAGMYEGGGESLQKRLCMMYELSKGSRLGLASLLRNLTTTFYCRDTSDDDKSYLLRTFEEMFFKWSPSEIHQLQKLKESGLTRTQAEIELAKGFDYRARCDSAVSWLMDPTRSLEPPVRPQPTDMPLTTEHGKYRQGDFGKWLKMDRMDFEILCKKEGLKIEDPCPIPQQILVSKQEQVNKILEETRRLCLG